MKKLKIILTVLLIALIVSVYFKVKKQQEQSRKMDEFYQCVQTLKETKKYTTMNEIECSCNKICKTQYGSICP